MAVQSHFDDPEFQVTLRSYFSQKLSDALSCNMDGHATCYVMNDGSHRPISKKQFSEWVTSLCLGHATLSQPPEGIIPGTAGSQKRTSVPSLSGILPKELTSSVLSIPQRMWMDESELDSTISSGVPGPGYYGGKALKWLGKASLRGIQNAVILVRFRRYRRLTTLWVETKGNLLGIREDDEFYQMLSDMLEFSSDRYSQRIRAQASATLNQIFRCPTRYLGSLQISLWLCEFNFQMRRNEFIPPDVLEKIDDALTKLPLIHQLNIGASLFITGVCRYLMYKPMSENQKEEETRELYTWRMSRILCQPGRKLSESEFYILQELARSMHDRYPCAAARLRHSWFYEMDIFINCSITEALFKNIILSPQGIPFLLQHLTWSIRRKRPFWFALAFLMDRLIDKKAILTTGDLRQSCLEIMFLILRQAEGYECQPQVTYFAICIIRLILLSVPDTEKKRDLPMDQNNRTLLVQMTSWWSGPSQSTEPYAAQILHNATVVLKEFGYAPQAPP